MATVTLQIANLTSFPLAFIQYNGVGGGRLITPCADMIPVGQTASYQVSGVNPSGWFHFVASTGDSLYIAASNPQIGTNKLGIGQDSGLNVYDAMTNNNYESFSLSVVFGLLTFTATAVATPGTINFASVVIAPENLSSYTLKQQLQAMASQLVATLSLSVESGGTLPTVLQAGQSVGYYEPYYTPPQNAGSLSALCKFGGLPYAITNYHFMGGQPIVAPPGDGGICFGNHTLSDVLADYSVYSLIPAMPLQAGVAGIIGGVNWPLATPKFGATLTGFGRKSGKLQFTVDAMAGWANFVVSMVPGSARPQPGDSGTLLLDNSSNAVAFLRGYNPLIDFILSYDYRPGPVFSLPPTRYMVVSLPWIIPVIAKTLGPFTPIT